MTKPLCIEEFAAMERLMADLLAHCEEDEAARLLLLHHRLTAFYESQAMERQSLKRLRVLSTLAMEEQRGVKDA